MNLKNIKTVATLLATMGAVLAAPAHAGKTLDSIKARGQVICGVHTGLAGFSAADSSGKWSGIDADVCRAVAAATLGDGDKVKFVPLVATARFAALQSGEVDVLSRNTTFTLARDASLGLSQTAVTYYDGQGQRPNRVRAIRHHHRKKPDRLLQSQRLSHQARGV
jgi:general L-amino acid transport system substrate-binding protein